MTTKERKLSRQWDYKRLLLRPTLTSETIFGNSKPFKSDGKCILFHLKSSFRSQNI